MKWWGGRGSGVETNKKPLLFTHIGNTHAYIKVQRTGLLLYLLSINSVWCRAIGEEITSSLMASVIKVHTSFRRPLCYRFSHLFSISLTILLACLLDSHLASPSLFLLNTSFYSTPPPHDKFQFVTVLSFDTYVGVFSRFYMTWVKTRRN